MGRSRPTPEDIVARGLPLEAAFQRYAPPRKLREDRLPLASLMTPVHTEQADAEAEVLLGLKVIRDTIYKYDELTRNRWTRFRSQLASGRLTAAGFLMPRAENDKPVLIPNGLWPWAHVDLSLSSLSAGETSYEGLRIFRPAMKKRS